MSRPRGRTATRVAGAAILLATLTGCGQSEYCKAVEQHEDTLNALGVKKTTVGYAAYARAFRAVARVAPASTRGDWTTLAEATQGVLDAHRAVGITLDDTQSGKLGISQSSEEWTKINKAYEEFNNTTDERKAVVKNVKDECGITLS